MWLRLRGQTVSALKGCQEHTLTGFQKKLLKGSFGQEPPLQPTMCLLNRHCPRQASLAKPYSLRKPRKSPAVRELTQQRQETLRPGGGQVG